MHLYIYILVIKIDSLKFVLKSGSPTRGHALLFRKHIVASLNCNIAYICDYRRKLYFRYVQY